MSKFYLYQMAKMVMHFLEYSFNKDFVDNCSFVFFAILSIDVIHRPVSS